MSMRDKRIFSRIFLFLNITSNYFILIYYYTIEVFLIIIHHRCLWNCPLVISPCFLPLHESGPFGQVLGGSSAYGSYCLSLIKPGTCGHAGSGSQFPVITLHLQQWEHILPSVHPLLSNCELSPVTSNKVPKSSGNNNLMAAIFECQGPVVNIKKGILINQVTTGLLLTWKVRNCQGKFQTRQERMKT